MLFFTFMKIFLCFNFSNIFIQFPKIFINLNKNPSKSTYDNHNSSHKIKIQEKLIIKTNNS